MKAQKAGKPATRGCSLPLLYGEPSVFQPLRHFVAQTVFKKTGHCHSLHLGFFKRTSRSLHVTILQSPLSSQVSLPTQLIFQCRKKNHRGCQVKNEVVCGQITRAIGSQSQLITVKTAMLKYISFLLRKGQLQHFRKFSHWS